jgi:hypothetical protein
MSLHLIQPRRCGRQIVSAQPEQANASVCRTSFILYQARNHQDLQMTTHRRW